ncbi:MAG: hypothetical protein ACOC5S_04415 [Acidobacteriota bacterium]
MKKALYLGMGLVIILLMISCGGQKQEAPPQEIQPEETSPEEEISFLNTREGMEKKLEELGFPIYPGAEFVEVKEERGEYQIAYEIPEKTEEVSQKVSDFYSETFEKMKNSGWESIMEDTGHFDYLYQKGSDMIRFTHRFFSDIDFHQISITYKQD